MSAPPSSDIISAAARARAGVCPYREEAHDCAWV